MSVAQKVSEAVEKLDEIVVCLGRIADILQSLAEEIKRSEKEVA